MVSVAATEKERMRMVRDDVRGERHKFTLRRMD